ncbi:MFS transporter [Streptomyces scopuliridis]|uniref:MFS transporter n=1 Tax=Streptomyces scopuliridis TaxID=452529 RepID=UPI003682C26C
MSHAQDEDPAAQAHAVPPRRSRVGPTLAVVLLGYLTLPMAMSGTTVALPRIGADLDAAGAALNWVVTGYFLAASSFMLVAGSLGDFFGRRSVFGLGAALYTAGTLASASAGNILLLDAARVLSGIGAAGVMASGSSLLAVTFSAATGTADATRTRVFAAIGTASGVGLALGPTFSGWMVDGLGWRATFLTYAGAGALILLGTAFTRESRAETRPRVDKAGAATFIGGLALTLFAVTQGSKEGWISVPTLLPLAAGLALLAGFVRIEKRAAQPVLDLSLTRDRAFVAWPVGAFGLGAGTTGILVFLPAYLQGTSGVGAREAGTILLLMTTPVLCLPPLGARLVNRGVPARRLIVTSLLLIAAGNAWLTTLHPGISAAALAGPLLTIGIGQGLSLGIIDAQALGMVAPERSGMASGFLNTVRGGTGAVMLTLFGALLLALLEARMGSAESAGRISAGDLPERPVREHVLAAAQFTDSLRIALWCVAGLSTGLALLVHQLLRPPRARRRTTPRPRPQPLPAKQPPP